MTDIHCPLLSVTLLLLLTVVAVLHYKFKLVLVRPGKHIIAEGTLLLSLLFLLMLMLELAQANAM